MYSGDRLLVHVNRDMSPANYPDFRQREKWKTKWCSMHQLLAMGKYYIHDTLPQYSQQSASSYIFFYFSAKFLLRSFLMLLDIVCPVRWLECVCIVHFWCLLTGLNVSRKYKKKNVLNWPTSNWTMNGVAFSILWLPCCKLQLISSTEVEGISQRLQ